MTHWQFLWCGVLILCAMVTGNGWWATSLAGDTSRTRLPSEDTSRAAAVAARISSSDHALAFERNDGQTARQVRFLSRGAGYTLYFTADAMTWVYGQPEQARVVRMTLLGANSEPTITGSHEQPGKVHYFHGNNPAQWRTNIPTFSRVHYRQIYRGIDLVYYGRGAELEYDFVVAAGADPTTISMQFDGTGHLAIDRDGNLVLETPAGKLIQRKPLVYQQIDGHRRVIESAYTLTSGSRVGFALGAYDRAAALIIDPVLAYSTFLGGTGGTYGDQAYGMGTDALDNIYISGKTLSTSFPVGTGAPANNDLFVVKLTPAGALAYVAIVNGNASDSGESIAVDAGGQVYVTGFTDSTDFPTLNPIGTDQPARDAFLVKLDASGVLVYSTYLGGSSSFDYGEAVAVDPAGNAYVSGATSSGNFPTLNARQPVIQGQDAFVVKVGPTGNLLYGTFLGGSGAEAAEGIAVDGSGSFYVTGWTTSSNFPRAQSTVAKQSGEDAFVSQYTPDGREFVYSRYVGGDSHERAFAIALDGTGGVYVGGRTDSTTFPRALGLQNDQPGTDAFLTRLGPAGVISFSTYLGGSNWERILALSVRDGHLFATGQTYSTDFPTVNAIQPFKAGGGTTADAFVVDVDIASGQYVSSTYLGGTEMEEGRAVVPLPGGNVFVSGWTESSDFPTVRPIQNFKSNVGNVFVTRLAPVGVDGVSPNFALAAGGSSLSIAGQHFVAGAAVVIGGVSATNVSVVDATMITATTPPLPPGTVDISVTNPDGGRGTLYDALVILSGTGPVADAGPDMRLEAADSAGAAVVLDGSSSFDPDSEPLTYTWTDDNGNVLGTGDIITAVVPLGVHTITLTVSDGHSAPAADTASVTIVDKTAPTVTVITPNGANVLYSGTPTILEWTASDTASGLASFDVYLSTDGGVTYNGTPICGGVSGALRSCTWTSPAPATSKARIRVTARDAAGNVSSDSSNANFTTKSGAAYVTVVTPTTSLNWGAGSTQQIKWNHNLGSAAWVRLDASLDGGATWSSIAAAVKNNASSSGIYYWTLPASVSATARIRVSWNNGPVSDVSNVNFTIANPYIALSAPTAGASWGYGTTRAQTWTTNLGPLDRVAVLLSTDGGASFLTTLATGVAATTKTATFVTPTLSGAVTTTRMRVAWINPPAGLGAQGTNPADFRIEPAFVTLTTPNGGNTWTGGTSQSIKWNHNLGGLENVLIELSQDDGASYTVVMLPSTPSDGAQTVTVGASWVTPVGRLRVTWLKSTSVSDASDTSFVIQ
jgi:hypothetical protein